MKNTFLIISLTISIAFSAFGQSKNKPVGENPTTLSIKKIEAIFNEYIKYSESTDSEENKKAMTKSLNSLNRVTKPEDLELLLNVWMYYDPTDYPTRVLVFKVLKQNDKDSQSAIKARIKNKKDWEEEDGAPYSELKYLLHKLEEK